MSHLSLFTNVYSTNEIILRVFCIGVAISSLEYLFTLRAYSTNGIFSWRVFRLTPKVLGSRVYNNRFDALFEKKGFFEGAKDVYDDEGPFLQDHNNFFSGDILPVPG